ncbi:hypothetical protein VB776_21940 [Arcicella sp. DC2W]|uniref:Uncharacterized protein n=1 Tax=Arcicella gelida TaxID=2984195 RepID=A0ABU5SB38_9BACT|nr:hypothetical protein [Arcicella sp. DC2W]MEA5405615.1 hypothetical protein [Arcicella sp. DC2W]
MTNGSKQSGRFRLEEALQCVIPSRLSQIQLEEIKQKRKLKNIKVSLYSLKRKFQNLFTEEEQVPQKQLIGIGDNLKQYLKKSAQRE